MRLEHHRLPIQHFAELSATLFTRNFLKLSGRRVHKNISDRQGALDVNFYCEADELLFERA